jgi:hypothetical protein
MNKGTTFVIRAAGEKKHLSHTILRLFSNTKEGFHAI